MLAQPWSLVLAEYRFEASWQQRLAEVMHAPFIQRLHAFLHAEAQSGQTLYPPSDQVFQALTLTPFHQVKVVILGQDPYHRPGQAQGLSFSVPDGIALPPSLRNIMQELQQDVGVTPAKNGDLSAWAYQGVLLLNAVLTVREGQARSHQGKGWECFTDEIIRCLSQERENLVFLLWGKDAQKKAAFIDDKRHCVLLAPHPSPLSAHRGWFGCRHFSKANLYLQGTGQAPINWQL